MKAITTDYIKNRARFEIESCTQKIHKLKYDYILGKFHKSHSLYIGLLTKYRHAIRYYRSILN